MISAPSLTTFPQPLKTFLSQASFPEIIIDHLFISLPEFSEISLVSLQQFVLALDAVLHRPQHGRYLLARLLALGGDLDPFARWRMCQRLDRFRDTAELQNAANCSSQRQILQHIHQHYGLQ